MKAISIYEIPMAVYQLMCPHGQIITEDFFCPLEVYVDAYESARLSMLCDEYVIIGDYALFCSDKYKTKRYAVPKSSRLLYLPVAKIIDGKIGASCSDLGFPNDDVRKILFVWNDSCLISPLANLHQSLRETARLIDVINARIRQNNQAGCSGSEVEQLAKSLVDFLIDNPL